MKKIILIASSVILLIAIALSMYLLNGCQKNVEEIKLWTDITVENKIYGTILNSRTLLPESGVKVYMNELEMTESLNDGSFSIDLCNQEQVDTIIIKIQKDNFIENEVRISDSNLFCPTCGEYCLNIDLHITPIADNFEVSPAGVTRTLSDSINTEVVFPEGCVNETTSISITTIESLEFKEVEGKIVDEEYYFSDLSIFKKPFTLSIDNDQSYWDYSDSICFYLYDEINKNWNIYSGEIFGDRIYFTIDLTSVNKSSRITKQNHISILTNSKGAGFITHRSSPVLISHEGEYLLASGASGCNESLVLTWDQHFPDGKFGLTRSYSGKNTCLKQYKKQVLSRSAYVARYKFVITYKTKDEPNKIQRYEFYWPNGGVYFSPVYCNYEKCCPDGQFWCDQCNNCIAGDKAEHDCVVHQGGTWVNGKCHQGGTGN